MKTFDVICLGIAVVDILAKPVDKAIFDRDNTLIDEIIMAPGGDAVNQSINLKKLGANSALCCRIGNGTMANYLIAAVSQYGVDISLIKTSNSVTSTAIALISGNGDRNIICKKGNNYDFCLEDIDLNSIKNAKILSVGSLFGLHRLEDEGLLEILKTAKENNTVTFADMTSDKRNQKLKGIASFLPYIDYFMPSESESTGLTGLTDCKDNAKAFLDTGAKNVVIKLDRRGAYAHCTDYEGFVNPFIIKPADTTGAGDAFCSGFIYGVANAWEKVKTLEFASACGAFNSLYVGANTAPISKEALEDFIKKTPRAKFYE